MTPPVLVWLEQVLDDEQARGENLGHFSIEEAWLDCPATRDEPLGDLEWGPDACNCGRDRKRADILAGVEADRAILAEHAGEHHILGPGSLIPEVWACERCSGNGEWPRSPSSWPCRTVLLVASRYRHRPGYLASWAPDADPVAPAVVEVTVPEAPGYPDRVCRVCGRGEEPWRYWTTNDVCHSCTVEERKAGR